MKVRLLILSIVKEFPNTNTNWPFYYNNSMQGGKKEMERDYTCPKLFIDFKMHFVNSYISVINNDA
jgi:hypothetical protein